MFPKHKTHHSLNEKDTWESYESKWDPYLRLDVLSLAFKYRRFSDKIYVLADFSMKGFSTNSSLVWKLKMSLGQDEPIGTYSHPYTRRFLRQAYFGGRVGTSFREFESAANTSHLNIINSHFNSNSYDNFDLLKDHKKYIDVYEEKYRT